MLTRDTEKWYVDQAYASHSTFATLSKAFFSYFKLPLHYDTGIELLIAFHQSYATCLSDHVQEWRRRRRLCRAPTFDNRVYMDLFLINIFPSIGKYVVSHFPHTEEEAL